ncbi:hypothetical protein DH2020_021090 [Rehmannia glutinosa]|uniref:Uncharacterized protein n=1 Tax=Rehmannia glutinosa TaxID=99300 RepID=A0ABR0WDS5_REHGL
MGNCSNKIWIFWNSDLSISTLSDLDQVLHISISSGLLPTFLHGSFIYAKCTRVERRVLWDNLRDLTLMTILGFQMISDTGLIDVGFEGANMHTWTRNGLQERLDRVLINTKWGDIFKKSIVSHLARVVSDHSHLLFLSSVNINKPPAAFRFMNMWARHPTFLSTIKEAWIGPTGFTGLKNLHHKLIRAERLYDSTLSTEHLVALKQSIAELILATKIEEDFWHQKSSCKWIVEGERNIRYFHNLIKTKRIKSRIHSITENGHTLTSDAEIQKSCVQFFSSYLSNDTTCLPFDGHHLVPHLPNSVNLEALCASPSADEVKTDWSLRHRITSIRKQMATRSLNLVHTHREANKVADNLAKIGRTATETLIFSEINVPRAVNSLARLDQLELPSFRFNYNRH